MAVQLSSSHRLSGLDLEGGDVLSATHGMTAAFAAQVTDRFDCTVAKGRYHGYGSVIFKNSSHYLGAVDHGRLHGYGVYTWDDKVQYKGDFKDNLITGEGYYTWNDGSEYRGEVKDGRRHGRGIFTKGPHRYEGEWRAGQRHGIGILYFTQDRSHFYEGEFADGKKHGWGRMKYKSGSIYEGQWDGNQREGYGIMRWLIAGKSLAGGAGLATTAVQDPGVPPTASPHPTPAMAPVTSPPRDGTRVGISVSIATPQEQPRDRPPVVPAPARGMSPAPTVLPPVLRSFPTQGASAAKEATLDKPFAGLIALPAAEADAPAEKAAVVSPGQAADDNIRGRMEVYEGEWKAGKPHGVGTYTWLCKSRPKRAAGVAPSPTANAFDIGASIAGLETPLQGDNVYKGYFKDGVRDGCGMLLLADGTIFEGRWEQNVKQGVGLYTRVDGTIDILQLVNDTVVAKQPLRLRNGALNEALFAPLPGAAPSSDPFHFLRREAPSGLQTTALRQQSLAFEVVEPPRDADAKSTAQPLSAGWRVANWTGDPPPGSVRAHTPAPSRGGLTPASDLPLLDPTQGASRAPSTAPIVPLRNSPNIAPDALTSARSCSTMDTKINDGTVGTPPNALSLSECRSAVDELDVSDLLEGDSTAAAQRDAELLRNYILRHLPELKFLYRFYAMMGNGGGGLGYPSPSDSARDAAHVDGLAVIAQQTRGYDPAAKLPTKRASGRSPSLKSRSTSSPKLSPRRERQPSSTYQELHNAHLSAEAKAFATEAAFLPRFEAELADRPVRQGGSRRETLFLQLHCAVQTACKEALLAAYRTQRTVPAPAPAPMAEARTSVRASADALETTPGPTPREDSASGLGSKKASEAGLEAGNLKAGGLGGRNSKSGRIQSGWLAGRGKGSFRVPSDRRSAGTTPTKSENPSPIPTPRRVGGETPRRVGVEVVEMGGAGAMRRRESIRIVGNPRASREHIEKLMQAEIPFAAEAEEQADASAEMEKSGSIDAAPPPKEMQGIGMSSVFDSAAMPYTMSEEYSPLQAQWIDTPGPIALESKVPSSNPIASPPMPTHIGRRSSTAITTLTGSFGGSLLFGDGRKGSLALGIPEFATSRPVAEEAPTTLRLHQFWAMLRDIGVADKDLSLFQCNRHIAPILSAQPRVDLFKGFDMREELMKKATPAAPDPSPLPEAISPLQRPRGSVAGTGRRLPGATRRQSVARSKAGDAASVAPSLSPGDDKIHRASVLKGNKQPAGAAASAVPAEGRGQRADGLAGFHFGDPSPAMSTATRRRKQSIAGDDVQSRAGAASVAGGAHRQSVVASSRMTTKRKSLPSVQKRTPLEEARGAQAKSDGALGDLVLDPPAPTAQEKLEKKTAPQEMRDPDDPSTHVYFWIWVRCLVRLCDVKLRYSPAFVYIDGRQKLTLLERLNWTFRNGIAPLVESLRLVGRSQMGVALQLPTLTRPVDSNLSHLNHGQPFALPASPKPTSPKPTIASLAAMFDGKPDRGSKTRLSLTDTVSKLRGSVTSRRSAAPPPSEGAGVDASSYTETETHRGGVTPKASRANTREAVPTAGERTSPTHNGTVRVAPFDAGIKEARAVLRWLETEQDKHRDARVITLHATGTGVTSTHAPAGVATLQAITLCDQPDTNRLDSTIWSGGTCGMGLTAGASNPFAVPITMAGLGATVTPPEPLTAVMHSETYCPPKAKHGHGEGGPPVVCLRVVTEAMQEDERTWQMKCRYAGDKHRQAVAAEDYVSELDQSYASMASPQSVRRVSQLDATASSRVSSAAGRFAAELAAGDEGPLSAEVVQRVFRAIPAVPAVFPLHFRGLIRARPVLEVVSESSELLQALYKEYSTDGVMRIRDLVCFLSAYRVAGAEAVPSAKAQNMDKIAAHLAAQAGGAVDEEPGMIDEAEANVSPVDGGLRGRIPPRGGSPMQGQRKDPTSPMTGKLATPASGGISTVPATTDEEMIGAYALKLQAERAVARRAAARHPGHALPPFQHPSAEWVLRAGLWFALGIDADTAYSTDLHTGVNVGPAAKPPPLVTDNSDFGVFGETADALTRGLSNGRGKLAKANADSSSALPQLRNLQRTVTGNSTNRPGTQQDASERARLDSRGSRGTRSTGRPGSQSLSRDHTRSFMSRASTSKEVEPIDSADPVIIHDMIARDKAPFEASWCSPPARVTFNITNGWIPRAAHTPLLYHEFVDIVVVAACVSFGPQQDDEHDFPDIAQRVHYLLRHLEEVRTSVLAIRAQGGRSKLRQR